MSHVWMIVMFRSVNIPALVVSLLATQAVVNQADAQTCSKWQAHYTITTIGAHPAIASNKKGNVAKIPSLFTDYNRCRADSSRPFDQNWFYYERANGRTDEPKLKRARRPGAGRVKHECKCVEYSSMPQLHSKTGAELKGLNETTSAAIQQLKKGQDSMRKGVATMSADLRARRNNQAEIVAELRKLRELQEKQNDILTQLLFSCSEAGKK